MAPVRRRYYKKKQTLRPLAQNIGERLSRSDSRLRRSIVRASGFAFVGFVIYSFLAGPYGFFRLNRLETHRDELIQENRRLLVEIVDADITRRRLQHDAHFQEYIARTRYLMARPDETVIRIRKTPSKEQP
ncbi:MAG: septum formation initiator family protein [Candidatus Zixiibacteriota bacterium]